MGRPRKENALTGAQRQARFRAKKEAVIVRQKTELECLKKELAALRRNQMLGSVLKDFLDRVGGNVFIFVVAAICFALGFFVAITFWIYRSG